MERTMKEGKFKGEALKRAKSRPSAKDAYHVLFWDVSRGGKNWLSGGKTFKIS
jgi:hypothetical protein